MSHPLESVVEAAEGFLLIGHSGEDRFPGFSYDHFTKAGRRFYCLDMGGLTESRGPTKGGKVYATLDSLPKDDVGELAVIWVKPNTAKEAVDLAHAAGCTRVWFSFLTGHRNAVAHARELGMEVVEIGRCPVYYSKGPKSFGCRMHTGMTKLTGTFKREPQLDAEAKRREIF